MISESFFRQIMDLIVSDDKEQKTTGALAMGNVATGTDITQANAFATALSQQAAAEPDPDVQQRLFNGLLDLIEVHNVDPAALQQVFDMPRDGMTEENASYIDDFIEYRDQLA